MNEIDMYRTPEGEAKLDFMRRAARLMRMMRNFNRYTRRYRRIGALRA